jgi:hypothetical protein
MTAGFRDRQLIDNTQDALAMNGEIGNSVRNYAVLANDVSSLSLAYVSRGDGAVTLRASFTTERFAGR